MSADGTIRRQHRFTVTPEHLILDPRISDRAFRLWCRLDRFAGERTVAFPTRETLTIELDTSKASIDRALTELVDAGWLKKERRANGDQNNYMLIVAPESEVERLVKAARKARVESTQPRRDKERERRRKQKAAAKVKASADSANDQVTEGGVVTSEDTPNGGGVVTHDDRGVVTGEERGVVTGEDQKEAPPEGSNREGSADPSLRSVSAAEPGSEEALFATEPTAEPTTRRRRPAVLADIVSEAEAETCRDSKGEVLRGEKLDALAKYVTDALWEWRKDNGHTTAQSWVAVRGVVRAALAGGVNPKDLKIALAKMTEQGHPITGAALAMGLRDLSPNAKSRPGQGRSGYTDASWDRNAGPDDEDLRTIALLTGKKPEQPPATGTDG